MANVIRGKIRRYSAIFGDLGGRRSFENLSGFQDLVWAGNAHPVFHRVFVNNRI